MGLSSPIPPWLSALPAQLVVTAANNGVLQLVTSGVATPANAFWSGTKGGSGGTTASQWTGNNGAQGNFTTTLDGATSVSSLPGSTTAVTFSNAGSTNLTNTLGASFDIGSLTFLGSPTHNGAVTINADGSTLTLESGGLTMNSGAGAVAIGTPVALNATQTWANASSSNLTVSGVIGDGTNGAAGLTINNTSSGSTILQGVNTYSGGTTLMAGTLTMGNVSA